MEKITFVPDGEEAVDFYVLEQTTIGGVNYILVTDAEEDEEGEAYILKDISEADAEERVYSMVEDDTEFDAVSAVISLTERESQSLTNPRVLYMEWSRRLKLQEEILQDSVL